MSIYRVHAVYTHTFWAAETLKIGRNYLRNVSIPIDTAL